MRSTAVGRPDPRAFIPGTRMPVKVLDSSTRRGIVSYLNSYRIAYGHILAILASTFDRDWRMLPDPRPWSDAFAALRDAKTPGYFWGSEVHIPPLGAYQIFEGQARFTQLQYLYFGCGGRLTWERRACPAHA